MLTIPLLLAVLPSALAHFKLNSPPARGFDEDKLPAYPCGGQDTVSTTRTPFSLSGQPIQLEMGHSDAKVQVTLALGNNPSGGDFSLVVIPTFQENGPDQFCINQATVAAGLKSLNLTAGTNATLLVQTNGDSGGNSGLYNCADITFTNAAASNTQCTNSTGVQASALSGSQKINANGTTVGAASSSSSASGSASGSSSGSAASPTSSKGGSDRAAYAVGAGVLGFGAWLATLL